MGDCVGGWIEKKTNTRFFLEITKEESLALIQSCCTRPLGDSCAEHDRLVCSFSRLCVCVGVCFLSRGSGGRLTVRGHSIPGGALNKIVQCFAEIATRTPQSLPFTSHLSLPKATFNKKVKRLRIWHQSSLVHISKRACRVVLGFVWKSHLSCNHLCITMVFVELVERLDLCVNARCYVEEAWQWSRFCLSRACCIDGGI